MIHPIMYEALAKEVRDKSTDGLLTGYLACLNYDLDQWDDEDADNLCGLIQIYAQELYRRGVLIPGDSELID